MPRVAGFRGAAVVGVGEPQRFSAARKRQENAIKTERRARSRRWSSSAATARLRRFLVCSDAAGLPPRRTGRAARARGLGGCAARRPACPSGVSQVRQVIAAPRLPHAERRSRPAAVATAARARASDQLRRWDAAQKNRNPFPDSGFSPPLVLRPVFSTGGTGHAPWIIAPRTPRVKRFFAECAKKPEAVSGFRQSGRQ